MKEISSVASLVVALALGVTTIPSVAGATGCESEPSSVAAHIFDMSDTNEDDVLSPTEFSEAGLERYGVSFEEFDVNGDGETSVDEYFDLFDVHHPPHELI